MCSCHLRWAVHMPLFLYKSPPSLPNAWWKFEKTRKIVLSPSRKKSAQKTERRVIKYIGGYFNFLLVMAAVL